MVKLLLFTILLIKNNKNLVIILHVDENPRERWNMRKLD